MEQMGTPSAAQHPGLSRRDALPSPVLEEELRLENIAGRSGRVPLLRALLVVADALGAVIAAAAGAVFAGFSTPSAVMFVAIATAVWVISAFIVGLYAVEDLSSWASGVPVVGRQVGLALLLSWPVYGAARLLDASVPIAAPLLAAPLTLCFSAVGHSLVRAGLHRLSPLRQRTVIVGSGVVASQINEGIARHAEFGLLPVGILDDEPHRADELQLPVLGTLRDLRSVIASHKIDRVIIAFSRASHEELLDCLRACRDERVAVDVVPRLYEFIGGARSLDQIGDVPLLSIGVPRLPRSSRAAKRLFDVTFAATGTVILSPLFLITAIAIKLESRGPVFFRQRRVGRGGKPFNIIRFRSMYRDTDRPEGQRRKLNDQVDEVMSRKAFRDPRVTRVGRLLRRLSLDELPQLINVLRGEMSLVGPRPLMLPEEEEAVAEQWQVRRPVAEQWQVRRLELRPGLTGPWQIAGRSDLTAYEALRLDFQYVMGWSLARDIAIVLSTVPAVFSGRASSGAGGPHTSITSIGRPAEAGRPMPEARSDQVASPSLVAEEQPESE